MTWDAGKQLLETLASAAAKGHHEQVLEESTAACNQLVQLYMGFLDLRSKTRAIRGEFDTALDDAATMQQLAPASALGYLRGGYIYDMRGLRREAIRVYDEGLSHVAIDDPAYQLVVNAKSSSEEALNRRFDFMDQLPPDILMNIVPRFVGNDALSSDKQYPYLNVSKRWHHVIPPIANFHFIIKQPKTLDQGHDHLVSVSRHVKTLTLQGCPKTINRFFQRASFEALTQLTIKANEDSFLLLLRVLGKNLTHLTISNLALKDNSSIKLQWVLLDCNCPNLKSLDISDVNTVIDSLHLHPKLEELSMNKIGQSIRKEAVHELLSCFPSLKALVVDTSVDPSILTMVQERCPSLYKLWFGFLQATSVTYQGSGGIYDLILNLDRSNGAKYTETVGLLARHCQTLMGCRLLLESVTENHGQCDVDFPSDVQFNRLDTLHIASWGTGIYEQWDTRLFEWIIQRSPNIRHIYVSGTAAIQEQIIRPICNFTSLRRAVFHIRNDDAAPLILQFLQHHHSLGIQSTIHELGFTIFQLTSSTRKLLGVVTQLSQLQVLRIEVYGTLQGTNMPLFIQKLGRGCPNLKVINLACYHGYQEGILSQLHLIKSLKTLVLFKKPLSDDDAVALTKCQQLDRLSVYGCATSPSVVKFLASHIPHLTFKEPRHIAFTL
ncbi:hypothetical protein O0I10_010001 [Lichtheimia ornata]|uniref:F-box domain-containing protein n=1 Tax=Lichtheimia ornata TaxID=688661 RepID=A0AAD7XTX9_9FUNG|nr:uncharacterized protein O0I10_010001 [Lichtheimia ornata]KAJ8654305.1 hypothetical protein O0I10_010001 [Lichtheimia ornata]